MGEVADAKKKRFSRKEVLELAGSAQRIVVVKGKKVVELDMVKARPDDATLLGLMLGPSGNLRAPTARLRDTLVVGFQDEAYKKALKD